MTTGEYVAAKLAVRDTLRRYEAALRTLRRLVEEGEAALAATKLALAEAQRAQRKLEAVEVRADDPATWPIGYDESTHG